jgi:RNA polymerase sigma-70 factor (ECF subfamily)
MSLIKGAIQGDADAFGELYKQHMAAIYRYIFFRVGNREDAEDLTEQVFLKAWEALPNYKDKGFPFQSWLYRIAHNSVVDHHRRQKEILPMPYLENLTTKNDPDHTLAHVIMTEENETLAEAVAQLPEIQQQVIILRFIEGLNHKKVADILQKSYGACRTIQYRALAALNRLLSEEKAGIL